MGIHASSLALMSPGQLALMANRLRHLISYFGGVFRRTAAQGADQGNQSNRWSASIRRSPPPTCLEPSVSFARRPV